MGEWREIGSIWQAGLGRQVGLADHLRAHRDGRSDAGGRGRHGAGGAALHLPRHRDTTIVSHADARTTSRTAAPTCCRTSTCRRTSRILRIHGPFLFGMTDKLLDATPPTCARFAAGRDAAPAQHDGHRRHRPARARDAQRSADADPAARCSCAAPGGSPPRFLDQAEFIAHVGAENIVPHLDAALDRARALKAAGAVPA